MKNRRKTLCILLAVVMLAGIVPAYAAADSTESFDDVKPGDWYYDAVMTLTEGGLFHGYGNGKFGPDDTITWGQFQLVMSRLTWGQAYGDESGIDLNTDMNKMVMTRGLTAVQMVKTYNKYCFGYYSYPNNTFTSVDDFPDSADIINWCYIYQTELYPLVNNGAHIMGADMDSARSAATNYILKSYTLNMFKGVDDKGTFAPYVSLTRAQFCQILYNMGWLTADCEYFTK